MELQSEDGALFAMAAKAFPQSGIQNVRLKQRRVTKLEDALRVTSRHALTTVYAELGTREDKSPTNANVNAEPDKHIFRARFR